MKCAILISLYNAEKTLDKTFESLQAQTWQDFRIIAINDCSKDGTLTLLKKWQEKFGTEKFLLIDNERNIGLTKSLNKGLDRITEPYTARIDADDRWDTTKLKKQIDYLEQHPKCGLLGTWYTNISSKNESRVTPPVTDAEIRKSIFRKNPFAHSCVIFKTDLIKQAGKYDESVRYGQDYDLWIRLFPKTTFMNIPEFLCSRNIEGTLTSSGKNQRAQMFQCVKTQLKYLNLHNRPWKEYRFIIEPLSVALAPEWLRKLKRKIF